MAQTGPPNFDSVADAAVKRAFLGRPETTEWIQSGTKLYKWTKSIASSKGITPWWLFLEPRVLANGRRCPGLRERQEYARRLGVSDRNYHRVRAGVTKQWNPMTRPIAIMLTSGMWGYVGKAAGQLEDGAFPGVFLIAGEYQAWIPGLKAADICQISVVPYIIPNAGTRDRK
jgi:hypothetical protein